MRSAIKKQNKGFTLIEMLIVIAIIAILVSVLVPTVLGAVTKAKAGTDAANLRSILSVLNISILDGNTASAINTAAATATTHVCKTFSGAVPYAVITNDYISVYYFYNDVYYGIDYFASVASGQTGITYTAETLRSLYGQNCLYALVVNPTN